MSVGSIVSASISAAHVQPRSLSSPERIGEKENDGDSDDKNKTVNAVTTATVNSSGNTIGSTISVKA